MFTPSPLAASRGEDSSRALRASHAHALAATRGGPGRGFQSAARGPCRAPRRALRARCARGMARLDSDQSLSSACGSGQVCQGSCITRGQQAPVSRVDGSRASRGSDACARTLAAGGPRDSTTPARERRSANASDAAHGTCVAAPLQPRGALAIAARACREAPRRAPSLSPFSSVARDRSEGSKPVEFTCPGRWNRFAQLAER